VFNVSGGHIIRDRENKKAAVTKEAAENTEILLKKAFKTKVKIFP